MKDKNIKIKVTPAERDLIIDHTYADPGLTNRIRIAEIIGNHLVAKYDYYELEDLIGYIAAEANHTTDKTLGKKFDKLFDKLSAILERSE